MNFDFTTEIDRRHSQSIKWAFPQQFLSPEERELDPLPMWVADMDFRAPPAVLDALHAEVTHGIFGYSRNTASYDEAVVGWQARRFGWQVDPQWIVPTPGVVPGLAFIIQAFTSPGDGVLIQPPVYAPFHNLPRINDRRLVTAPLVECGDHYAFDSERFEDTVRAHKPRVFILCNPHNPTGSVWSESDLRRMGETCARLGVLVVSDEIHQDLIFGNGARHVPFGSLDIEAARGAITCTAPSKTFNLAGLQVSNLFVAHEPTRKRLVTQMDRCGVHVFTPLGMAACEAAYRHGDNWLDGLLAHVAGQHATLAHAVASSLPGVRCFRAEALYLAWLDFRGLGMTHAQLKSFLLRDARLWFDDGEKFGPEGSGFMRINLGCTRATLEEAIERLRRAIAAR